MLFPALPASLCCQRLRFRFTLLLVRLLFVGLRCTPAALLLLAPQLFFHVVQTALKLVLHLRLKVLHLHTNTLSRLTLRGTHRPQIH